MTTTSEEHMTRVPTSKHSDDLDEIRKLTLGLRLAIVGLEAKSVRTTWRDLVPSRRRS